jgi:hypothetical protein
MIGAANATIARRTAIPGREKRILDYQTMASRVRCVASLRTLYVNAAFLAVAPCRSSRCIAWRRYEAAELAFNECGKSDRGAILQVRSDDLNADR